MNGRTPAKVFWAELPKPKIKKEQAPNAKGAA
jgi:hypothetical protein